MLRGIFFDLDDTLVDQRSAAAAAVVEWAAGHGVTDELVSVRWNSVSDNHYARYQRREITLIEQRRARVREFLAIEVTDADADAIFAGYLARYKAGWVAFDDAVPALRRARAAGLTVAVLTNGDEEQQRQKLTRLGLLDEIDLLISSSVLPAGKPDPRAFRVALDILGVRADEVLMVGNSLENDVFGAVNAGIEAILVDRFGAHSAAGVPRVSNLDELLF